MTENHDTEFAKIADEKAAQAKEQVGELASEAKDRARELADKAKEASAKLDEKIHALDKMNPKELGDAAVKVATDTAYAVAGVANLIAEKAREFSDKQQERASLLDSDAGKGDAQEKSREFLDQLNAQLGKFVDDLGHAYKDLTERGRDTIAKLQTQQNGPKRDDAPGMFDLDDAADTAEEKHTIADVHDFPEPKADDHGTEGFEVKE